ncbi:MAG: putative holin [Mycobacterium sp.]
MVPLPRARWLTGALLLGVAAGVIAAVLATLLVTVSVRPDVAIGLVLVVPTALGAALLMVSGSRTVTAMGAFCLAFAPGWFIVLVLTQVVSGG